MTPVLYKLIRRLDIMWDEILWDKQYKFVFELKDCIAMDP